MKSRFLGYVVAAFALGSVFQADSDSRAFGVEAPPPLPREFRAAWVATVANIDWPSRPGLDTPDQKVEAGRILDTAARLHLNAIVLQVRPSADALYPSKLEPWSAFLTGKQGQAPEPYYDPLKFWVEEAHRRGLQLHAWFNPYRARYSGAKYEDSPTHVSKTHPEVTKSYGGMLWMDPGEPVARQHTLDVLLDVVKRYDIDGVHFDDYFYPYPVADADKKEIDFPDEPSWKAYQKSGGKLARADWRRRNISGLVEELSRRIKAEKPGVLFGISPFGIPRPGQPKGVVGFDQYDKLYADTVHWLNEGWCDYFSPQLYWKIEAPGQPFRPLLNYWIAENTRHRHIWPGLSVSRVGAGGSGYAPEEILGQIAIIRETPGASGAILFSMKALLDERRQIGRRLEFGPYSEPALVPASPWLALKPPGRPVVTRNGDQEISVQNGPGTPALLWAVQALRGETWTLTVHPAIGDANAAIALTGGVSQAAVTAVDRVGNASAPVVLNLGGPESR